MKKIFSKLMAAAIAAFVFTACEDVPEPYNNPYNNSNGGGGESEEVVFEPAGKGTLDDPYNVARAIELTSALADGESLANAYVKGYIVEITDMSTSYGNCTYYISDDEKGSNRYEVYRGYGLNGDKFTTGTEIKEGDLVVVKGTMVNFKGNTPELTQGSEIVSINGEGGSGNTPTTPGEAKGTGTLEDPFNATAANAYIATLAADAESEKDVYIKGKIIDITDNNQFSTQYGNCTFYISDDGKDSSEKFYVFRTLYLGNVKYTSGTLPKAGDEVIICGKVVNFKGNTPETAANKSYIYSLNGQTAGGETPPPTPPSGDNGKGTADAPYTVAGVLGAGSGTGVYVKAYIVGNVEGQVLATGAKFGTDGDAQTNLLLADAPGETSVDNCIAVQLPSGDVRSALNLKDNPGNYKKEVVLYGNIEKYFGKTGVKSVSFAIIDGKEIGTNPNGSSGGDTPTPPPSGDAKGTGTLADPFNAAAANAYIASLPGDQESTQEFYIKGKIIEITDKNQFSTQYGNCTFYISDDGKDSGDKFYVFRTLYLGNVKYTEGPLPKAGDEVIICGKVVNFKGNTPETAANKSYIYSLNGKTTIDDGGGNEPSTPTGDKGTLQNPFNAAEANAFTSALEAGAESDKDVYIKGKIIEITDKNQFSPTYGNCTFYISDDGTDSGEKFYVFRTLYFGNVKYTEGPLPKAGDEVIICGKVMNFKGNTPETSANKSYIYSLNGQTSASRQNRVRVRR